jgi:hypothetical protein
VSLFERYSGIFYIVEPAAQGSESEKPLVLSGYKNEFGVVKRKLRRRRASDRM